MPQVNYQAATQGLERGVRIGAAIDQVKRAKSQDEYQTEMRDIEMTMKKMQLETLKDDTTRQRVKRDLKTSLFHLENMKSKGPEYFKQLQQNPQMLNQVKQGMNGFGSFMANRGMNDGLIREFQEITPVGQDKDGNPLLSIDLKVHRQDGSSYFAPLTNNRSNDPNDTVKVFTEKELFTDMARINGLIDMYESALVGVGDDYPIEKRTAGLKRKAEIEDREDKQKHELAKAKLKELGGGTKQGDIQLMEYFKRTGLAKTDAEAFKRVQALKTNPTKEILSIAKQNQKSDAESYRNRGKEFSEYIREAEEDVNDLMGRLSGEPAPVGGDEIVEPGVVGATGAGSAGGGTGSGVDLPDDIPPQDQRRLNATYQIKGKTYIWRGAGKGWEPFNAQ